MTSGAPPQVGPRGGPPISPSARDSRHARCAEGPFVRIQRLEPSALKNFQTPHVRTTAWRLLCSRNTPFWPPPGPKTELSPNWARFAYPSDFVWTPTPSQIAKTRASGALHPPNRALRPTAALNPPASLSPTPKIDLGTPKKPPAHNFALRGTLPFSLFKKVFQRGSGPQRLPVHGGALPELKISERSIPGPTDPAFHSLNSQN